MEGGIFEIEATTGRKIGRICVSSFSILAAVKRLPQQVWGWLTGQDNTSVNQKLKLQLLPMKQKLKLLLLPMNQKLKLLFHIVAEYIMMINFPIERITS